MLNVQIYGQRDARWANDKMGGGGLLKDYGCTVTCLSSLLSYLDYLCTPGFLNKKDIYWNKTNLVDWNKVARVSGKKFVKRVSPYNNWDVWTTINIKRTPVLVEVMADPIGNKGGRHWVLFVGSQKCIDPWSGSITSTSMWTPTGYAIYQ